jgi:hypothetical protein
MDGVELTGSIEPKSDAKINASLAEDTTIQRIN